MPRAKEHGKPGSSPIYYKVTGEVILKVERGVPADNGEQASKKVRADLEEAVRWMGFEVKALELHVKQL